MQKIKRVMTTIRRVNPTAEHRPMTRVVGLNSTLFLGPVPKLPGSIVKASSLNIIWRRQWKSLIVACDPVNDCVEVRESIVLNLCKGNDEKVNNLWKILHRPAMQVTEVLFTFNNMFQS